MKALKYVLLLAVLFAASRLLGQPSAPTNLQATSSTYSLEGVSLPMVRLTWDKVMHNNDAIPLYEVFKKVGDQSSSNDFVSLGDVLWSNMKFDRDVEIGQTYTYYVIAKDGQNNVSGPSNLAEVTVGETNNGVKSAVISGVVTDATNSNPLENINVIFISTSTLSVDMTQTDAGGNYSINVLPGEYLVYFRAMQDYYPQFYDGVRHSWEATRVNLNDGEILENINAALVPMFSGVRYEVSGRVTDEQGNGVFARIDFMFNTPVVNIQSGNNMQGMQMQNMARDGIKKHVLTDENGNFTAAIPEGAEFIVYATPINQNLVGEYYNDTYVKEEAEVIKVSSDIPNIDFVLSPKADANSSISGMIMNSNSEPVKAMLIAIKKGEPMHSRERNIRIFTDDGNFSFNYLTPGNYIIFAIPDSGYIPTFYNEEQNQTVKWQDATEIVVNENSTITGIEIKVMSEEQFSENGIAQLNGVVKDKNNNPVTDAFVTVRNQSNMVVAYTFTNSYGEYVVDGIVPGFYNVVCTEYGLSSEENTNVYVGIDEAATSNFSLNEEQLVSVEEDDLISNNYELEQNYPNPFNPSTTIRFSIKDKSNVVVKVYNILGAEVATLVNERLDNGVYSINFDASDLPSGVYVYQLNTDNFVQSKKMILLK